MTEAQTITAIVKFTAHWLVDSARSHPSSEDAAAALPLAIKDAFPAAREDEISVAVERMRSAIERCG